MSRSPLFDIYDPYGTVSGGLDLGLSDDPFGVIPVKRKPRVEDLLPEEEKESMLRYLANQGASGLSGLGWLLDTPGAVVRGALSGGPLKGLSALIESSDDRITGRELLRQYGLVGDQDSWTNFGTGLAAEILLDPTSYVSLGIPALLGRAAKTGAGKLAARSGMLVDDLGLLAKNADMGYSQLMRQSPEFLVDQIRKVDDAAADAARNAFFEKGGDDAARLFKEQMTASNRISFPGFGDRAVDLYGKRAGDAIARAADNIGDFAKTVPYIGGVTRAANAMFSARNKGFTDEAGQWFGREITDAETRGIRPKRQQLVNAVVDAARNLGDGVFNRPDLQSAIGDYLENQAYRIPAELQPYFERGGEVRNFMAAVQRWNREALQEARKRGIPLEKADKLPNNIRYLFRQRAMVDNPTYAPGFSPKATGQYDKSSRVASVVGGTPARRDYTRSLPRWVLNEMAMDGGLQASLREAPNGEAVQKIIDEWVSRNAADFLAQAEQPSLFAHLQKYADEFDLTDEQLAQANAGAARANQAYNDLADSLRRLPLEHAKNKIPFYGNPLNDIAQYTTSRGRNEAVADVLTRRLTGEMLMRQAADTVPGGQAYTVQDALKQLGYDMRDRGLDPKTQAARPTFGELAFVDALNRNKAWDDPVLGIADLANMSLPKQRVDELSQRILASRAPREVGPLLRGMDKFTQSFKQLALLWPARYSRDAYSGSFAAASQDAFGLGDFFRGQRIGSGDYKRILPIVRKLPDYVALNKPGIINAFRNSAPRLKSLTEQQLLDELMIRKFLKDSGGVGLSTSSVLDDVGRGSRSLQPNDLFPGMGGATSRGLLDLMKRRPVPWNLFSTTPGTNWLLDAGDRAAKSSDDFNRIGTYANRIRKGDSPLAAKATSDLTQVLYGPENFTAFEREVLKRAFPFYSYTKGITPLLAKEFIERPQGLLGQSVRFVNRAGEPSEDQFTPEYLRQSAAIPLTGVPFLGTNTPGITRFLTNIDLPHEGVVNLFTPGISNTVAGSLGDSLMKTGQNILGQSNPLIKGPLEWILNRQFYSGRQLSDLYSVLEQSLGPVGRGAEQLLVNIPGGSRALGTYRQLTDSRISGKEAATKFLINALTGVKLQDVDQERTARLAARTTLNQLLDQTKGVSSYENLFIKPEDLAKLSPQEQKQYLLYRVLQSQASREARERKKKAEDPLAILGVL
jgi:hypothetical protein